MRRYWVIGYWVFGLLLIGLGGLSSVQPVYAVDQPTATLTAAQSTLTVGDVVTLTLAVTHSADAGIVPVTPDRNWGDFEIRTLSPVTTQANADGSATSRQQMGVTLWLTGTHGTPPLTVSVVDGAGKQAALTVTPISLTVTSVLTSTDRTLRDIKAQATLPVPPLWPWLVGGAVGVLLLGSGAWWLYRRWRRRPQRVAAPTVIPDLRPAHQIALAELERIQQLQLPAQWRFKEHYSLTTEALRRYLAGAFAIPALDQTTAEIRQSLRETPLSLDERHRLLALLNEADLVKFADVTPAPGEAEALVSQARAFVLAAQAAAPVNSQPAEVLP